MGPVEEEVTVTVKVPENVERVALQRALDADAPERFEEYLLDHLVFDFEFQTESDPKAEFTRCPRQSAAGVATLGREL